MFEPKIYKKNGLEAFRLVGSNGSEFFYEGAIDCNDKELYKDTLGRLYYPVIAEIGGAVKYYVELDPQVPRIPFAGESRREKAISGLVNASPRPEASLPDDIFVRPEEAPQADAPQADAPQADAPQADAPQADAPQADAQPEEAPPAIQPPEPVLEVPAQTPEPVLAPARPEHVKSEKAASAIQSVFSQKVDILHPPPEQPGKAAGPDRAASPVKAGKKRSLKWPLAIAVVIVLLAACAIGVYILKPGAYDGLRSLLTHPAATPAPAAAPTEEPSPSPAPSPTPAPDEGKPSASITGLIDSDSPIVAAFAGAHTNATSAGNRLGQTCDLFGYVNGQWKYSDNSASRKASEIAGSLEGNTKDYTALMMALMKSLGIESRIIIYYAGGDDTPRYYPEILAANTSAGYQAAMQQFHLRYGVAAPQGHSDDTGYWIALGMGNFPGIRPPHDIEYSLIGSMISPLNKDVQ